MEFLNFETIPLWILIISILPSVISPAMGVLGIVHGFIKLKQKYAWLSIILSDSYQFISCAGYGTSFDAEGEQTDNNHYGCDDDVLERFVTKYLPEDF